MELTGKCKEEFIEWYDESIEADTDMCMECGGHISTNGFENIPDSMRYGVLVDYFDSVEICFGVAIYTIRINETKDWCYQIMGSKHTTQNNEIAFERFLKTRPKARTKAIEKANEIRNEQLNK